MITIILPWPNPKLNPNQSKGHHWGSTVALRKKARNDAYALTPKMHGLIAKEGDIGLRVTFMQPDKRNRDRDNLLAACKPSIDGIADALEVNDSRFNPVIIRRGYSSKEGYVIVEVEVDDNLTTKEK